MTKNMNNVLHFPPFSSRLLLLGAVVLTLAGCKKEEDVDLIPESCEDIEWTYAGPDGPDQWDELCTGYQSCGGQLQSPVNLAGATDDASLGPLTGIYSNTTTDVHHLGHTIQFRHHGNSFIVVNGQNYALRQFHLHTQSEHTVNGAHHPVEVHLVHENTDGSKLAVVAVFLAEGNENSGLQPLLDNLPQATGDSIVNGTTYNADVLLPSGAAYLTYGGSLTTPPCSEIVTWIVMEEPLSASAAQLARIEDRLEENYRPAQPLNGRTIRRYPG